MLLSYAISSNSLFRSICMTKSNAFHFSSDSSMRLKSYVFDVSITRDYGMTFLYASAELNNHVLKSHETGSDTKYILDAKSLRTKFITNFLILHLT